MDVMAARRRLMLDGAYRRVEYLESSGTQYLLLPTIIIGLDTVGYEMKSQFLEALTGTRTMCSTREIWASSRYVLSPGLSSYINYRIMFDNKGGYNYSQGTDVGYQIGDICLIKLKGNYLYYNDTPYQYDRIITGNLDTPFPIFGAYNGLDNSVSEIPHGRVYYFKLIDGDTLKFYGIPCVRKADSKPGMYDTVSKTFYTNAGTGEFIIPS